MIHASIAATAVPISAISTSRMSSVDSTSLVSLMLRAICAAPPGTPTVRMRYGVPPIVTVRNRLACC